MKEFKSSNPNIDIKVTTLHGEEVEIKGRYILTAKKTGEIMDHAQSEFAKEVKAKEVAKEAAKKAKKPIPPKTLSQTIKDAATELEYVYDKDAAWFMEHLELTLINEIVTFAYEVIGGVVKK